MNTVAEAIGAAHISGDGGFTAQCHAWLERELGAAAALLMHTCTAALEAAIMLADVGPGDEVVMPSFTFVSTANAVVLRGATPVFVDVRPDTLNLDETRVEDALGPATKAILPIHYAGVGAEMDELAALAYAHGLVVIEDAAQGLLASYRGRPLGSIGQLAALSFHETKNVTCGEGGALIVNDNALVERAEIVRAKGTNRARFLRGDVDKYTWVDIGSSYALSDLAAAFLWAQLGRARQLTDERIAIWERYHTGFERLEQTGRVRRPVVPADRIHNGHMYYLLVSDLAARTKILLDLNRADVNAVFHYVPLHSSPAGARFGRTVGPMTNTDAAGTRLLRLPLWAGMTPETVDRVVTAVEQAVGAL